MEPDTTDTTPDEIGGAASPGGAATNETSAIGPSNATTGPSCRPHQRLHRASRGRMIGGVAAGVADYLDIDPTLARIGFVALAFLGGLAVPLYLAGWLLIPDEDTDLSLAEELFGHGREREREHSRAW